MKSSEYIQQKMMMDVDKEFYLVQNLYVHMSKAMALASKFRKDISTLQAAVNKEIFLDHKHPKLYKKLERYYVSQGLATLTDEDPDYDYNIIMECIEEDLKEES